MMTKEMEELIDRAFARASRNAVIYDEPKITRTEQLDHNNPTAVIRSKEDAEHFMAEVENLIRKAKE
jgi:hypothetical protein